MLLETSKNFSGFELLDSGLECRLERWGEVILQRSDPQAIWQPSLPNEEWEKAWAVFDNRGKIAEPNPASAQGYGGRSAEGRGNWEIKTPLPSPWIIKFGDVKFLLKLSPFKHTGLFAEQAAQWEWMINKLSGSSSYKVIKLGQKADLINLKLDNLELANKFKVLNLFAYTGGATMVLAKAGCQVTHVDASKPAITWANENHKLNNLPDDSVRWILDDAAKFVKRELKRGVKYDGIIMDPPAFGHSPTGKTWKFNDDLPRLLSDCVELLSDNAKFLIVNGYATNSSALALNNLLEDSIKSRPGSSRSREAEAGKIEFGELCLKQKTDRLLSTGIFARWTN